MLYFDHNATAPLHSVAKAAWLAAQERFSGNPSSLHRSGQRAEVALETAREFLARHLSCQPAALLWTSGATEAANAVFAHLAQGARGTGEVWISAIEHPCVAEAAARYFPKAVRELPVTGAGALDLGALEGALSQRQPVAVGLMAANNETGVLQPWREALELCRAKDVPLVCDATQWLGRLPAEELGECDYVFGSGHKCGAPVGVGFLKAPQGFKGLLVGGGQEEGRRAGTQNVAGAAAFVAALGACAARFIEVPERLERRGRVEGALLAALPGTVILGGQPPRLWNTIAVLAPELADCRQRWVVRLDAAGVAASSGSACASGREAPSRVLSAMGIPAGASDRVLRLSGGWDTETADWAEVVRRMAAVLERWR
ncbi:MAG: cysteine desulfurase [Verrucomicrobia bacterium]|nr:MAG: cysteine desulfurase [Verrucomicrobiota bacterium]